MRKVGYLIFMILLAGIVSSETTIQVQEAQPQKQGFFAGVFSFLGNPIFWWIVIGAVLIIGLLIGLFFLVRWIVKWLKSRNDIFHQLKSDRMKMARIHARYKVKSYFKPHKNLPIRLVKKESGKLNISEPIGYYKGDYATQEGNIVISMNLKGNNKYWFFPIPDLLVVPDKEKIEYVKTNKKGKQEIITIDNLPRSSEIVQFNENEILIFAESLSNSGQFLFPVLRTKDGKILDLTMPVYQSLKEVILGDYLYLQTNEFAQLSKRAMDLNPYIRSSMKLNDSNTNVEIPNTNKLDGMS
jgi:hypothetical protein